MTNVTIQLFWVRQQIITGSSWNLELEKLVQIYPYSWCSLGIVAHCNIRLWFRRPKLIDFLIQEMYNLKNMELERLFLRLMTQNRNFITHILSIDRLTRLFSILRAYHIQMQKKTIPKRLRLQLERAKFQFLSVANSASACKYPRWKNCLVFVLHLCPSCFFVFLIITYKTLSYV